ncbi:hypothetical protein CR513_27097, partial [Mucuna pruriens]
MKVLNEAHIHSADAVPSSLHQKLKFIVGYKLVFILGEKDILLSCPKSADYIEVAEEVQETSFQSLEIISTSCVKIGLKKYKPTNTMITTAKIILKRGYRLGQGLGKNSEGVAQPIQLLKNPGRYELRFKPNFTKRQGTTKEPRARDPKATRGLYENFTNTDEEEIDWEPPKELKKLVELKDRIIQPHKEGIETINLGCEESKRNQDQHYYAEGPKERIDQLAD